MLDRVSLAVPALPAPRRAATPPPAGGGAPRGRALRAGAAGAVALAVWAAMTGPQHWADPATWAIGGAAALAVAGLVWRAPARPRWRLSLPGALRLAAWFAAAALRGAVDVARRAVDPALPVAPGWYRHPLRLPPGAPRLVMANAITLLPGTLTAEMHEGGDGGEHLILHLLDARTDPGPDLAALEARVRGLFALPTPAAAPANSAETSIRAPLPVPLPVPARPKDTP